jgi:hypothetical protein
VPADLGSHRTFGERAAWSTWIYRVSLNVCMTLLETRKRDRRIFASDSLPPELVEDSRALADESLNRLYDAIRQLSEADKAVILLRQSGGEPDWCLTAARTAGRARARSGRWGVVLRQSGGEPDCGA